MHPLCYILDQNLVIGHFSSRYNDDVVLLNEAKEIFPNTSLADEERLYNIV